jgi:hypothetical protein
MAKRKRTDVVKLQLRIREGLRKQLEDTARVKDVSLNAEIVSRLEQSFVQASLQEEFHIARVSVQDELKKLWERFEKEVGRREEQFAKMQLAGKIERVPMRPEELEAAMAANKQLEAKLTASLSDVEKLKAQLSAMLDARQSKGGKP